MLYPKKGTTMHVHITSDIHLDSAIPAVFGGTHMKPSISKAKAYAEQIGISVPEAITVLFKQGMYKMLPPADKEGVLILAGDTWVAHKMFSYHGISWIAEVCSRFKHVVTVAGNHCLDMETELLTNRGWMHYDNIVPTDKVFSIDPSTKLGQWTPILSKFKKQNHGEMLLYKSNRMDFRTTPDHRFIVRKGRNNNSDLQYVLAKDVCGDMYIPSSTEDVQGVGVPLSDDQLRLFGWILSDGCISTNKKGHTNISISQSKAGNDIEGLLISCGISYTKRTRVRDIKSICGRLLLKPPLPDTTYYIAAASREALLEWLPTKSVLPEWLCSATKQQFDTLLSGIVSGNGVWTTKAKESACVHGRKLFLDSLQAFCVTKGWRATMSIAREKDYRLNISRRAYTQTPSTFELKSVQSQEEVWCLTVPMGNFMCRRKGKAYFTGNCNWGTTWNTWHKKAAKIKETQGLHNLHILENSYVDIDGIRFIGATLWTDMDKYCPLSMMDAERCMNDFQYIKRLTSTKWVQTHIKSVGYLNHVLSDSQDMQCVVVTHHAPCSTSVEGRHRGHSSNAYYYSDLTHLLYDRHNVPLWCHGHCHENSDYTIANTRVLCSPVGYGNFNPNFVTIKL